MGLTEVPKQYMLITKGLPASGKSTWAKEQCEKHANIKRVNRDAIRAMLGMKNGKWNRKHENLVVKVEHEAIRAALREGYNVIVDDTNLNDVVVISLKAIADEFGVPFFVQDFFDVPVEECIKRDAVRPAGVGKDVILRMYHQYMSVPPKPSDPMLLSVILCDLDGTLALFGKANPYNRDFSQDVVNTPVKMVLNSFSRYSDVRLVIMSGRSAAFRDVTEDWLADNGVAFDHLFMRPEGDRRKDTIVKKELYQQYIEPNYNVLFVIDDRPSVVRMWRAELGLTVFQVAPDVEF